MLNHQRIPCNVTLDFELVAQLKAEAKKTEENLSRTVEALIFAGLQSKKNAAAQMRAAEAERTGESIKVGELRLLNGRSLDVMSSGTSICEMNGTGGTLSVLSD